MLKISSHSKSMLSLTLVLLVSVQLFGCSAAKRKSGFDDWASSKGSMSESEQKTILQEAKKLWQTRQVQADLENALKKFEKVAQANPKNREVLVHLARGYYLLADAHLENMEEKKKNWEISVTWGERGLALNDGFRKSVVDEKKPVAESLGTLTKDDIDSLYWAAASLGKWAKNSGIATTLKYKNQIRGMIEKVGELSPDYFYGAVHRYWGVYYAVAPGFAGGSMDKSWESFQKSLKVANNYFGTHVLVAENYAPKKSDKALFEKELKWVLAQKANVIPELTPENTLEQKKAKKMLEQIETYF